MRLIGELQTTLSANPILPAKLIPQLLPSYYERPRSLLMSSGGLSRAIHWLNSSVLNRLAGSQVASSGGHPSHSIRYAAGWPRPVFFHRNIFSTIAIFFSSRSNSSSGAVSSVLYTEVFHFFNNDT